MKCFYSLLAFLFMWGELHAQGPEVLRDTIVNRKNITPGRNQLLLIIEREQRKADISDGVVDQRLDLDGDTVRSNRISNALFTRVNQTVAYIENNGQEDMQQRRYLGRLIETLKQFNSDINDGDVDVLYYHELSEYTYAVIRGIHQRNLEQFVRGHVSKTLYQLLPLFDTETESVTMLMRGLPDDLQDQLIKRLSTIKVESAADAVVAKAALRNPKLILNYATSTSAERQIVRRNKAPEVKAILQIADSCKVPLRAIFFMQEYLNKRISLKDINDYTEDEDRFFSKMTELHGKDYSADMRKSIDREFVYLASRYVDQMNELHEAADAVRFKCVEKMNAAGLYYVMVFGADNLYTSSFLGSFHRFMQRIKPKTGDQFLDSMRHDKFRTFIRLCANYNTLAVFLQSMQTENQQKLMRSFVQKLDETPEKDLEGATDVANSLASIQDSVLLDALKQEITLNRAQAERTKNRHGFKIYDILLSMLSASGDSITLKYGIPPITIMPYKQLADDSGVVYQQVFFYGDDDGKGVFNYFLNSFPADQWKITREEKWVRIQAIKGHPLVIFANKPLDEPEDEAAQNALQDYLDSCRIRPTVLIHRGHSYHLSTTLDHLNFWHKVVILGACGAYQNLSKVLNASEDAQIVSTKQIGSGKVNGPIIRQFNQRLLEGTDINWVELWAQLGKQFQSPDVRELFNDYVPPYKNLGALFLKAYRRMSRED